MTYASSSLVGTASLLADPALRYDRAYIDGCWIDSAPEELEVVDPASGAILARVPSLGAEAAKRAVDAAQRAFTGWAHRLPQERASMLRRWYDLILSVRDELAIIMTREQGKPLHEARGEIEYAASFVEYYAEEARRLNIESVTSHLPDVDLQVWREPLGVAALITPWNFPSAMLTRKAAAALAAGCTVVAHPSSETPLSALALAVLAERAGFPAGVFNVVTGRARDLVPFWAADPRVRLLSFTGSTEVGRLLYEQSATNIKRLVLELGGLAPFLVFADADLCRAVSCGIEAKFATSGQDCLAANRLLIERPVYQEYCRHYAEAVSNLSVGAGLLSRDIGPLINETAVRKQEEHVADAVARGARCLTGGRRLALGANYYAPTVLADVPRDALIFREETFGPVAALAPFDTEDEVVAVANNTEYGLIAYLHTRDPARISRVSRSLQYGMVAVNRTKVTGPPIPFGGVKQSGIGREGGRLGMEAFTEVKYVCRAGT